MKHIVAFFTLAFLCGPLLCPAREITLNGYPPAVMTRISAADKILNSLFRLKRLKSGAARLEISGSKGAAPRLVSEGNLMRLTLNNEKSVFEDEENFQALLSALFLSAGATEVFAGAEKALPRWICAALYHKLAAYEKAERYLHGRHYLPVISALYCSKKLPDLLSLPEKSPDLPPELKLWYGEFARVLLEAAADQKLLKNYTSYLLKTQKYNEPAQELLNKLTAYMTEKDQLGRLKAVEKILWNTYNPEPASRKLAMLQELLKWQIPELNDDGEPTGKMISCSLLELHSRLAGRPDAAEQRKTASAKVGVFCTGCTYGEIEQFQRLAILLYNTPRDPQEVQIQMQRVLDRIKKILQHREKIETYLAETEARHTSTALLLKNKLAVTRGKDSATAEQKKFLLETEKTYGD